MLLQGVLFSENSVQVVNPKQAPSLFPIFDLSMLKTVFKITVSTCLVAVLVYVGDISTLKRLLSFFDKPMIFACVLAFCFAQLLSSLRWQWVLKEEGIDVPLWRLYLSYMSGTFVNNLVPGSIGGDMIKIYDVYRYAKDSRVAVFSVFLERFSGLTVLLLLSWVGAFFYWSDLPQKALSVWLLVNLMFATFLFAVARREGVRKRIRKLSGRRKIASYIEIVFSAFDRLAKYKNKKMLLGKLLLVSAPIQLITIGIYQQIAVQLNLRLPFPFYLLIVPLIIVISLVPVSFGGLGVRESATVLLLSLKNVPFDTALALSLGFLGVTYLVSIIGGVLWIFRGASARKIL